MAIALSESVIKDAQATWLQHKDDLLSGKTILLNKKILSMVLAETMPTTFHPFGFIEFEGKLFAVGSLSNKP